MSDDLQDCEVVGQFHADLLVERLPDSDSAGFSNDLEKDASLDAAPKTVARRVFLQTR